MYSHLNIISLFGFIPAIRKNELCCSNKDNAGSDRRDKN